VWTDLFMWIERVIEGDRNERMKRDASPVSFDIVWRKGLKPRHVARHCVLDGRCVDQCTTSDAPTLTVEFWTGTASREVYFFTFPVHCHHLPAGRLGARNRSAPTCARGRVPVSDAGRAEHQPSPIRGWRGEAHAIDAVTGRVSLSRCRGLRGSPRHP